MRELLDWMDEHVEPYVSYRFVLGLVFAGMFVYWVTGNVLWLRELSRPGAAASVRERRLLRIGRDFALLLVLRACSWRSLRAHASLLAQVVVLLAAAIALSTGVFGNP